MWDAILMELFFLSFNVYRKYIIHKHCDLGKLGILIQNFNGCISLKSLNYGFWIKMFLSFYWQCTNVFASSLCFWSCHIWNNAERSCIKHLADSLNIIKAKIQLWYSANQFPYARIDSPGNKIRISAMIIRIDIGDKNRLAGWLNKDICMSIADQSSTI